VITLLQEFLDKNPDHALAIPEAGGDAAYSMWAMLKRWIPHTRVVMVDSSSKALLYWASWGFEVYVESAFCEWLPWLVLPTDEYFRDKVGLTSPLSIGPLEPVHRKDLALKCVQENCTLLKTPKDLGRVVLRGITSAGSKNTMIPDGSILATEYLTASEELVIDFNTRSKLVLPRVTHCLKNGRDTFCTLLGRGNDQYNRLVDITMEVATALGIDGLGNIQLLRVGDDYFFVEAAKRISGSAWLNLLVGNCLLTSKKNSLCDDENVHTNGSTLF
jgi:hypothetical protein